jgi:hypothetical protein
MALLNKPAAPRAGAILIPRVASCTGNFRPACFGF